MPVSGLRLFVRILCLATCLPAMAVAQSITDAARNGDMAALKAALPPGSHPDPATLAEPLFFAAQRGREEAVTYLLDEGAPPDAVTDFGSALATAARGNRTAIVEKLLAAGADPNLPAGEDGRMPLHDAAERGSLDAARVLLDHGADVNAVSVRWGWPAIQFAATKGRTEMVAFLRDHGAGPAPVDPLAPGELGAAAIEDGRVRALECGGCHSFDPGGIGSGEHPGPSLAGIVGRAKALLEGFAYSKAMRAQTGTWTPEELNVYLADPLNVVPGTAMSRGGQPDRAGRIAIIAWLATLPAE